MLKYKVVGCDIGQSFRATIAEGISSASSADNIAAQAVGRGYRHIVISSYHEDNDDFADDLEDEVI